MALVAEKVVHKFGAASDIDTSEETIWDVNLDAVYNWPSGAVAIEVFSTVDDDDPLDATPTGAWTVELQGLDANYNEQVETVTLVGQTPVAFPSTYLRVYRARVLTAGTNEANEGVLTFRVPGPGNTLAAIGVGNNQTLMAVYTIPAGYTGYLTSYYITVAKGKDATARLFVRKPGEVFQIKHEINAYQSDVRHPFDPWLTIDEKNDIDLRAVSTLVNTPVKGGFDIRLMTPAQARALGAVP